MLGKGADANRGRWSRLLEKIPGFKGYVDRISRKQSEQQTREHIARRLEDGKVAIDAFATRQMEAGNFDLLPSCDRVRGRIEALIASLRSGLPLGASFLNSGQLDEDRLDDLYEHDLWVMEEAEKLAREMTQISQSTGDPRPVLDQLQDRVRAIEAKIAERREILARDHW